MSKEREIDTMLRGAERRTNSKYGNPRWRLDTADGFYDTADDSACGYTLVDMTSPSCESYAVGRLVTLTVRAGRVVRIRRAD